MRGAIDRDGGYGSSIVTAAIILGGGAYVIDRLMAGAYLELLGAVALFVSILIMGAIAASVHYVGSS